MNYESVYQRTPIIVSITLYNYSYVDRKIIYAIKNNAFIIEKSDKHILVPYSELIRILDTAFKEDYQNADIYPQDRLQHGINTVYQLRHLLGYYNNLKLVNINTSNQKNYSKVVKMEDGSSMIAIDYKIDKAIIRYDEHFSKKKLKLFNELLRDIGVVKTLNIQSSYTLYINEYVNAIKSLSSKKKEKYKEFISFNENIFSDKLFMDNTIMILVTDF